MANKVFLSGYVGAALEVRYTADGAAVGGLRVATSERYKDKDGQLQEKTQWHNVTMFGDKWVEAMAKVIEKGGGVVVEGELRHRTYEKDGVKHYRTDVVAKSVEYFGIKAKSGGSRRKEDGEPLDSIPF